MNKKMKKFINKNKISFYNNKKYILKKNKKSLLNKYINIYYLNIKKSLRLFNKYNKIMIF